MNVHMQQPSKASRIEAYHAAHPEETSYEVARALGVRNEYVRAVLARRRPKTVKGQLEVALEIAQKTYRECLEARRNAEINYPDPEAQSAYQRAWDLHQAAEKVYLELQRPASRSGRIAEIDPRPLRGVPVRDIIERRRRYGDSIPVIGSVR